MLPTVKEIKHNLDGITERFDCRLLHRDPAYAVICYVSERPYTVAQATLPAGSLTIGHYWRGRGYILWEVYDPHAELLGHYIHLCSDVEFGDRVVEWRDMSVDLWFGSDGRSEILDEDELDGSVKTGQIGSAEAAEIRALARTMRDELPTIIGQLRRFDPLELLAALSG